MTDESVAAPRAPRPPLDLGKIAERIAVPPGADPEWRFAATAALQLLEALRAHAAVAREMLAELRALEWEACDPSAMPLCASCHRYPPDSAPNHDLDEAHDADCVWLAIVRRAARVLETVTEREGA